MFEDRSIKRKRRLVLAGVFLLLASAAFGVGYFFNAEAPEAMDDPKDPSKISLQIPDSLINPKTVKDPFGQVNADSTADQAVNMQEDGLLSPNTQMIFKTYFNSCGHSVEKSIQASTDEINMSKKQLEEKYAEWKITAFSPPIIEMSKKIDTYCPNHFIIGEENGLITIYVYDDNGQKVVQEKTDISLATLTPEDQLALTGGIVVDTEEQKEQTLEGFSD